MKSKGPIITAVTPPVGVPGGEITIHCRGFKPGLPSSAGVLLGDVPVKIVSASEDRVIARLPDSPKALGLALKVNGENSPVYPFSVAQELASGLHPVCNPALSSQERRRVKSSRGASSGARAER